MRPHVSYRLKLTYISTQDARSKSYPGSQSYSSKLFELELSPIFEDSPVFASTRSCILFEGEDNAGSQDIGEVNAKDEVVASDSSESNYGELIDSKVRQLEITRGES